MEENKGQKGDIRQVWVSILIVVGLIFIRFFITAPLWQNRPGWFLITHLGVVPLSGLFLYLERRHLSDFFLSKNNLGRALLDGCLLIPLFTVPNTIYALISKDTSFALAPIGSIPYIMFAGILGPGITEEFVFRGFLMGILCRLGFGRWRANLVQSIIFICAHWYWFAEKNLWGIVNVVVFAPLAGYITLKRKNLAGAFVLHVGEGSILNIFIQEMDKI